MIRIAATLGDPSSIGPEVGIKAIHQFLKLNKKIRIQVFAPRSIFKNSNILKKYIQEGVVQIVDPEIKKNNFILGLPSKQSAARALRDLERATDSCISGESQALVTGPLDKSWCAKVKVDFTGHTEFLERRTRSKKTVMLLAGPKLKVALVTTHLPLKKVPAALSSKKIIETGVMLNKFLKQMKLKSRIAILGLNPHASDRGLIGSEEGSIILPAVNKLKALGVSVSGPHSPDSFFAHHDLWDAVICMYHDQGLIPLKMLHFYDAVNITLGLPFLRTSVDHGTAFDIAGKGQASSESYENALKTAHIWIKKTGLY